ncbi:MAG: tripartite tricarboxylate transporter substrate binding protein [Betaproteobacteria bacterium]|nr:tripartite tricarboxylate transporter substrate binding protein [Betaproteobacteria bacterium]
MRRFQSFLAFCLFALSCGTVFGQSYPTQPIRLVTPWAPGAASEVILRLVGDRLAAALKQPVVIENKPGAGSTLGTDYVAKAPPDGYTLLGSFNSAIAPGPLMYSKLPYDPLKDFFHIALIGVYPQYMIVRTDSPIKSLREFLALVKAKPGAINYASAGIGTSGFLAAELLKQSAGLNMVHVPYKGPSPAISDLLGGRLDMVLTASAAELARAGKVRILAVTNDKRVPVYPDVPTVHEIVPGVKAVSYLGISAPAKTPRAITTRLETEIMAILTNPEMMARLSDPALAIAPTPLGSEKYLAFIHNEIRVWSPVIKAGNIRVD